MTQSSPRILFQPENGPRRVLVYFDDSWSIEARARTLSGPNGVGATRLAETGIFTGVSESVSAGSRKSLAPPTSFMEDRAAAQRRFSVAPEIEEVRLVKDGPRACGIALIEDRTGWSRLAKAVHVPRVMLIEHRVFARHRGTIYLAVLVLVKPQKTRLLKVPEVARVGR